MTRIRIATFNLENLDDRPGIVPSLKERIGALRPLLRRLDPDVLCIQEVNAQSAGGDLPRQFRALDALLAETPLAAFHRVSTRRADGGPADVHNLAILSRWPVETFRQVRHDLVPPPAYRPVTAAPAVAAPIGIEWDRPLLYAGIALPGGARLHVLNLHLRAPLAAPVPGQKLSPFVWKTVGGWAEGFYLAAMKRTGQALEARLFVDGLFDEEPGAMIAVAGDLNAELRETPVRVVHGNVEDTGNPELADRVLSPVESRVPADERFSVLHHGNRLMLDHLLASPALARLQRRVEIFNRDLADEYFAYLNEAKPSGSFHAPVVAEFRLPE